MLPDDYSEPTVAKKYDRNANLKPFPEGVSGNPHGRPLGSKNRATIAKELLSVELHGKGLNDVEGKFSAEYLVNAALLRKAMTGDVAAYKELHDTVYGKVTDKVGGDPEAPIVHTVKWGE